MHPAKPLNYLATFRHAMDFSDDYYVIYASVKCTVGVCKIRNGEKSEIRYSYLKPRIL